METEEIFESAKGGSSMETRTGGGIRAGVGDKGREGEKPPHEYPRSITTTDCLELNKYQKTVFPRQYWHASNSQTTCKAVPKHCAF